MSFKVIKLKGDDEYLTQYGRICFWCYITLLQDEECLHMQK